MATTEYFNNTNYKNYTKFTQENNLTLDDDIIVVQDISAEDMIKMDRLEFLSKKIYPTEAEKSEMTQLKVDLITYMPTANTINKIGGMLYGMQVYLKEGVVIFINQQKQELIDIVNNHKYMGIYVPLTNYAQGNMVMFDGYGFISKVNENIGHTPNKEAIDDGYWIRFTIKGEKGDPSLNIYIKKGADGSGNFDNTITYNTGDACIYDHRLYYCIKDSTVGINPTDTTKWAFGEKIWIGTNAPIDHSVIWWDTTIGQNVFKRYSDNNIWVGQNVKATDVTITDSGNYFTIKTTEGALAQMGLKLSYFTEVSGKLYYKGSKVGATVASEISLPAISGLTSDTNIYDGMQKLFTLANNGKTSIAGVVGNVTGSNTHTEIANEVQVDKNILVSNLNNKGIIVSSSDTLRNLSNAVSNITLSSMGGTNYATGQISHVYGTTDTVNFPFTASVVRLVENSSPALSYICVPGMSNNFYMHMTNSSFTQYTSNGSSIAIQSLVGTGTFTYYAYK